MKFSHLVFVALSFIFSLVSNGDMLTKLNVKYGISQTPTNTTVWVSFKRHKAFGNPPYDMRIDRIKSDSYVNMALASYYNASKVNITGLACDSVKYDNDIVTFVYTCVSVRVVEVAKNQKYSTSTQSQNQVQPMQVQQQVKTQQNIEKPHSQQDTKSMLVCANENVRELVPIVQTPQSEQNSEKISQDKVNKPQEIHKEDSLLSDTKLKSRKIKRVGGR